MIWRQICGPIPMRSDNGLDDDGNGYIDDIVEYDFRL